jgi:hypothetical protein
VWSASAIVSARPRPLPLQQLNKPPSGFGLNRPKKAARISALLFFALELIQ